MIIQFCIMHGYIPIFLVNFPRNWISIPYHHISPVSRGICERLKEVKAMIAKKRPFLSNRRWRMSHILRSSVAVWYMSFLESCTKQNNGTKFNIYILYYDIPVQHTSSTIDLWFTLCIPLTVL